MPELSRDGVRLAYERVGGGGRELVLVPGWCCDRTLFEPLLAHFQRSHTVTAVDPRWCTAGDARPPDGYDVTTLADDVVWLCRELGVVDPVVIGHSLGGMIGVELAARYPTLPAAIVALDPGPLYATPEALRFFGGMADQLEGPDGAAVRERYVRAMVDPHLEPRLAKQVVDVMCSVPLDVAAEVLRGTTTWNGLAAMGLCRAPLLVVLARDGGGSNAPERLRPLNPTVRFGVTVGSGHFLQLEVPEQVIPMIERFLATALPAT